MVAPTANGAAAADYGNFKMVQSFDLEYAPVKLSKWRSDKTGLTVTLGSHPSPVTNGFFVVASEIFDDTGRPHTLEHLVFLGSKAYPYKGVLDQLANRAGSNGTNAWTANDHTAYTISTAGSKGFLEMLPVYVDHILHPTMADCGFVTEIHHINGEGEDAGVVYSEMQARENQAWDRMSLKLQRSLYPQSSAYRSETGGLLKNLRVLTAEQIRQYHGTYYVPYNLCLHMDGAVDVAELFDVLNTKVEPMILASQKGEQVPPAGWKRPFVESTTSVPRALKESESHVVEFMEEDESMGEFMMTFLGPAPNAFLDNIALDILCAYLTESATSPLQKEFVEIAEPLATYLGVYSEGRVNRAEWTIIGDGVPKKQLVEMPELVKAKLKKIVESEGIDMERMGRVLRRERRQTLNKVESNIPSALCDAVVQDFLYCNKDGQELPESFKDLEAFTALEKWTAPQWTALLDKWFASAPSITVVGKPSAKLSAELEKVEKERVAKQKEEFGPAGLKELEEKLQKAKEESDAPIPEEILTSFPVTNPADLTWIPVETAINEAPGDHDKCDNGDVQRYIDADKSVLPYQTHFAHIKSNFVRINVLLDCAKLPVDLLPYLSIFKWSLFNLGVRRADGTELSHEEVVNTLNDFTVGTDAEFGYRGGFVETVTITIKAETAQYAEAAAWLRDIITGSIFSKDRLEVIIAKELQNLPMRKRNGAGVAHAVLDNMTFDNVTSPSQHSGLLSHLEFLPKVAEELKENPEKVIQALESLRSHLVVPEVLRVGVAGDILKLPEPRSTLAKSFLPIETAVPRAPQSISAQYLTPLGKAPSKQMELVSMASIEGSYSEHYAKGPQGWDHPELPAMRLATKVLNTMESYLWKSIRGAGLAYGANVDADIESGLVRFSIYRSPNALIAYKEAAKVIRSLADGSLELDQNIVDGACASLAYSYATRSETVGAAAGAVYLDEVLKGVGKNYSQDVLAKLPTVTLDEIREFIRKYFVPLFDPETSIGAVSVNAGKADEVESGFKEVGFEVTRRELPAAGTEDSDSEMGSGSSASGSEAGDDVASNIGEAMEDVTSP